MRPAGLHADSTGRIAGGLHAFTRRCRATGPHTDAVRGIALGAASFGVTGIVVSCQRTAPLIESLDEMTTGTVLVTGGTRGIGRAIALRLARDGFTPVVNFSADRDAAGSALEELRAIRPDALTIQADVTIAAECRRLVDETIRRLGQVDVLVNNVGPWLERPLESTTDEDWRLMIDGNAGSAYWCTQAALQSMRERKSGKIINIGALNAEVSPAIGFPLPAPAYFAAKSALMMLTRTFAHAEGRHGIRVNAVSPGFIETEGYEGWDEEERRRCISAIPLGRFGRPEEIADAVSFLVSERAAYITGAVLHVHGGQWT